MTFDAAACFAIRTDHGQSPPTPCVASAARTSRRPGGRQHQFARAKHLSRSGRSSRRRSGMAGSTTAAMTATSTLLTERRGLAPPQSAPCISTTHDSPDAHDPSAIPEIQRDQAGPVREPCRRRRLRAGGQLLRRPLAVDDSPRRAGERWADGTYIVPAGIHKIKHVIVIMQENRSFDSLLRHVSGRRRHPDEERQADGVRARPRDGELRGAVSSTTPT